MSNLTQAEICLKYYGSVPSMFEMMGYPVCCDCSYHWKCPYWKAVREGGDQDE